MDTTNSRQQLIDVLVRRLFGMKMQEVAFVPFGANNRVWTVVKEDLDMLSKLTLKTDSIAKAYTMLGEVLTVLKVGEPDAAASQALATKMAGAIADLIGPAAIAAPMVPQQAKTMASSIVLKLEQLGTLAQALDLNLADKVDAVTEEAQSLVKSLDIQAPLIPEPTVEAPVVDPAPTGDAPVVMDAAPAKEEPAAAIDSPATTPADSAPAQEAAAATPEVGASIVEQPVVTDSTTPLADVAQPAADAAPGAKAAPAVETPVATEVDKVAPTEKEGDHKPTSDGIKLSSDTGKAAETPAQASVTKADLDVFKSTLLDQVKTLITDAVKTVSVAKQSNDARTAVPATQPLVAGLSQPVVQGSQEDEAMIWQDLTLSPELKSIEVPGGRF